MSIVTRRVTLSHDGPPVDVDLKWLVRGSMRVQVLIQYDGLVGDVIWDDIEVDEGDSDVLLCEGNGDDVVLLLTDEECIDVDFEGGVDVEDLEVRVEVDISVLPKLPVLRWVDVRVDDVVILESGTSRSMSCAILSPLVMV